MVVTITSESSDTASATVYHTVRMSSDTLRELVTVAVCADKPGNGIPGGECVMVEWDSVTGELLMVATDRYRLAVATATRESDRTLSGGSMSWQALIPAADLMGSVKLCPRRRGYSMDSPDVELTVSDESFTIGECFRGPRSVLEVSPHAFPKWRTLIPTPESTAPISAFTVNPAFLATVAKLPARRRTNSVKLTFSHESKPVLVTGAGEFVSWQLLVMPCRVSS